MSKTQILAALSLLVLFGMFLGTRLQVTPPEQDPSEAGKKVVASVGTHSITLREVEQAVALPLFQADQQRSQLLHQALQQLIDEELLKIEASRKGVTVSQLVADASQSDSITRMANLPAPVKRLSPANTGSSTDLDTPSDRQEQARLRQALLVALRRQETIRLYLPMPKAPILSVSADDDPSLGPADAPVTIVEFSDFQCPYCQKSVATLKELRRLYGDKIRVVYRDYPGPNHPQAASAAEAAQCAGDQGKFWEFHDLLFTRQTRETGWDYEALARDLGLQTGEFSACLNTGRYREEVRKDLQDGLALGIASTPTFFINGRPLVGAQPLAEFSRLIEPLLNKPHQ